MAPKRVRPDTGPDASSQDLTPITCWPERRRWSCPQAPPAGATGGRAQPLACGICLQLVESAHGPGEGSSSMREELRLPALAESRRSIGLHAEGAAHAHEDFQEG
jgi:hypothetical protein